MFDPEVFRSACLRDAKGGGIGQRPLAVLLLVFATGLTACSPQQFYGAGQAWQQQECIKRMDAQDRTRCLENAGTSYDEYKRQSGAARNGQ